MHDIIVEVTKTMLPSMVVAHEEQGMQSLMVVMVDMVVISGDSGGGQDFPQMLSHPCGGSGRGWVAVVIVGTIDSLVTQVVVVVVSSIINAPVIIDCKQKERKERKHTFGGAIALCKCMCACTQLWCVAIGTGCVCRGPVIQMDNKRNEKKKSKHTCGDWYACTVQVHASWWAVIIVRIEGCMLL